MPPYTVVVTDFGETNLDLETQVLHDSGLDINLIRLQTKASDFALLPGAEPKLEFFNRDLHVCGKQDVGARTELNHPKTFAQADTIARGLPTDYPSRKYSRNLFTNNRDLLTLYRQCVLLVDETRFFIRRHQKLAGRIKHVDDLAPNRRTIDMHVEWRKKNADYSRRFSSCIRGADTRDFSVGGRDYNVRI